MAGQLNIRTVKLGDSADSSKNFLISTPAVPDGTLTIERADGTDVLTVDASGSVAFPGNVTSVALSDSVTNNALTSNVNTKLGSVTLTPGLWILNGTVTLLSTAASIAWASGYLGTSTTSDSSSNVRQVYVPSVVLNTPTNGTPSLHPSRVVRVTEATEYSVYANHAFSNGNACGAAGTIYAARIG